MAFGKDSFREVLAMAVVLKKGSKVRGSELYQIMLQKLSHVDKVLDTGCGEGKFVIFLAKRTKKKIVGLDISESGLSRTEKKAAKEGVPHLVACMKCDTHKIGECFESEASATTSPII